MDKKITWLHLSDLHFKVTEDNFESRLIYDKLLEDLKHIEEHIDLVFVTGDIAFSGRTEEYALASKFFNSVLEILNLKREIFSLYQVITIYKGAIPQIMCLKC